MFAQVFLGDGQSGLNQPGELQARTQDVLLELVEVLLVARQDGLDEGGAIDGQARKFFGEFGIECRPGLVLSFAA